MAVRGRPAALPVDGTPFDGPRVDVEARLAWLLRLHRLCSPDPDNRSLAGFARRLRATGVTCDSARVSRWETGRAAVPDQVVARYERVLGVPAGALRSVRAGLRALTRDAAPAPDAFPTDPPQDRLDRVYDRLTAPGADGGDWLDLADLLAGPGPQRVLLPGRLLESWVGRLVAELMRAVGTAYTTRFQALTALITHRPLTPLVAAAIDAVVREPGAQGVADPVSLLGEVGTPAITARLLDAFAHETGGIRLGSAHALLNLIVTGTLPATHHTAHHDTHHRTTADDPHGPGAALATMLTTRLPAHPLAGDVDKRAADQRVGADKRPGTDGRVGADKRAGADGRLGADATTLAWYELSRRTGAGALAAAARERLGIEDDPMLDRIVLEALGSRHLERRHHAGLLLLASPYRPAIAALTADAAAHHPHPPARHAAATLLRYVVGPAQLPVLHDWLTPSRPHAGHPGAGLSSAGPPNDGRRELVGVGLGALAHAGVPAGQAGRVDLTSLLGMPGVSGSALVYAAGMTGAPALRDWADDPGTVAPLRQAARWWLRHGPAIHS
jgi:hypothetical protein